ncbi:MAG: hypothetical protein MZV64_71695 [Ignavibacteriales bacterium]|nr:hypothetical protein [Ignavibacteriales bacterium]
MRRTWRRGCAASVTTTVSPSTKPASAERAVTRPSGGSRLAPGGPAR